MSLDTLQDLLLAQLRDLYSAEKQITHALPKIIKAAHNRGLADALSNHLEETQGHIARIEEMFQHLGAPARAKKCKGMEGLLAEGAETMGEKGQEQVIDAGLIADCRRVEHYEIAAYNATIAMADVLGHGTIVKLLQETLAEEEAGDAKLTDIARTEVNPHALTVAIGSA